MVYFLINGLKFNCGNNKNNCPKSKKSCRECMIKTLSKMGFEINSDTEIFTLGGKHLQMDQDLIWQKFLDVLNIRHIILMDKNSGVALRNYPVSAVDVNAQLLSGFIQANISFAESSKGFSTNSSSIIDYPFYEFQYKNFNILLKNGEFIRICIILDQKASNYMRRLVSEFLKEFENRFQDQLIEFQETGAFDSKNMIDFIINSFNIYLVFPVTLAHAFPPEVLKELENNLIQNAIITLAKELLKSKLFFYVNNLLNEVKKIGDLEAKLLLYEIYQLFEKKIFVHTSLETIAGSLESLQEAKYKKATEIKPISSIIISDTDMSELKEQIKTMNENSSREFIKNLIKKGKDAEKALTYEIARKEYNKALILAQKFNFKEDIPKISHKIFKIAKKSKQIELDFALETGENAEKNKDYINAIYYYQKALKDLKDLMVFNGSDSRIKKLKKKIVSLREEM